MPLPTIAGMVDPSNQQLNAARWTDKEPFASVPYLPALHDLIAGERKQIAPTEGVTAVQGMADPITHIATLIAPFAKATLSRQQPLIDPTTRILSSQRGSVGGTGDESTMDALKRMFLQRGGVESGQGTAIPSKVTPQQYATDMKANIEVAKNTPGLNDLVQLQIDKPHYIPFLQRAEDRYGDTEILRALNTRPELHTLIDNTYKLTTQPTQNTDQLLGFIEHNITKRVPSLDYAEKAGYIEQLTNRQGMNLGYVLTEEAQDKAMRRYLLMNPLE